MKRLYMLALLPLLFSTINFSARGDSVRLATGGDFDAGVDTHVFNDPDNTELGIHLTGEGFDLGWGGGLKNSPSYPCLNEHEHICRPGDTVDLSAHQVHFFGSVYFWIDGLRCEFSDEATCENTANLNVSVNPFTLLGGGAASLSFTMPFTFLGQASIFEGTKTLRSISFKGRGTVTLDLVRDNTQNEVIYIVKDDCNPDYCVRHIKYQIEPTATIPEPATMLLLSTGLAGIGGVIKRRRQGKE